MGQYHEFVKYRTPDKKNKIPVLKEVELASNDTPEESLEKAYQSIRDDLASDILEQIKSNDPTFFEHLVVD